jgi:hypothetical protein
MYADGKGVTKDLRAAVVCFSKAADHGNAAAQFKLGLMYENGEGVPQDFTAAVTRYRDAAERGDPDAQYKLGAMYASGKGMPRDDVTAFMWFSLAASAGNTDALESGEQIASRLSAAQLMEARKLVRDWEPKSNF